MRRLSIGCASCRVRSGVVVHPRLFDADLLFRRARAVFQQRRRKTVVVTHHKGLLSETVIHSIDRRTKNDTVSFACVQPCSMLK